MTILIWLCIAIVFIDVFIRHTPWWQQLIEWAACAVIFLAGWGVLHLIGMAARGVI